MRLGAKGCKNLLAQKGRSTARGNYGRRMRSNRTGPSTRLGNNSRPSGVSRQINGSTLQSRSSSFSFIHSSASSHHDIYLSVLQLSIPSLSLFAPHHAHPSLQQNKLIGSDTFTTIVAYSRWPSQSSQVSRQKAYPKHKKTQRCPDIPSSQALFTYYAR